MRIDSSATQSGWTSRASRLWRAIDGFAQREWRWLIVIAWLIIAAYFLNRSADAIRFLSLGDTDDNMRYLQVRDWLAGQSWWDLRQHRMAPPDGANIHWSRLVDLPIAALILFFSLFTDRARAEELAVGVEPLLPLLLLMLALAFIARRLSDRGQGQGWFIAMLLPLGAGMGLSMFMPLRIDHHGWQLALTATALAGLVDRKWTRGGVVTGVASALSVVIGMEMLVYLVGAGALIALRWIFKEGAARRVRPYALGLGGTTALGYALFASNANRAPVCDAISPVWASVLVLTAGVLYGLTLLPLRGWLQRLGAAALGGAAVLAFAWLSWPNCVTDLYGISPELQKSWLVYIREAKPIYVQAQSSWVPMISLPITGLLCGLIGCWAARRDSERMWAWATVTLMIAFAIALTFWQIRAGPAAQLLAIPPVAWAGWAIIVTLITGSWARRLLAVPAALVLVWASSVYFLYPIVSKAFAQTPKPENRTNAAPSTRNQASPSAKNASANSANAAPASNLSAISKPVAKPLTGAHRPEVRCRTQPALQPLDQIAPATIFTLVDLGPRLIAITHHTVIAGPYHRNQEAILDVHHAFDGSPETFRKIAQKRGATYLLYCPGFPEGTIYQRRSPKGFYARLARGETFPFLTPVTVKAQSELPYRLYRITPLEAQASSPPASPARGEKVPQKAR
ncbi:hypothetical protein [Sphingobium sp. B12D2B]|uniref:hypothetical protein n=1 Tax=Sphingobium sp. B12D2B TaxID=2940577 RepID=UPI002225B3A0|nr:hypothetical protein [Sphingobium sp. B12D2B]MCW2349619.1 hypothetical protein [Sphingobium sp. B12D2B]